MNQRSFFIDRTCEHPRHTKETGFLICCTQNRPFLLTWPTVLGQEPVLKRQGRDFDEAEERVKDLQWA